LMNAVISVAFRINIHEEERNNHATVRHVVSKDGKTTTSTSKGTGPDGKPFTSKNVFDKQ
jgi:hypothetical protein